MKKVERRRAETIAVVDCPNHTLTTKTATEDDKKWKQAVSLLPES